MAISFPCRLIVSQPASGAMNMALDEALLESIGDDSAALRIYQWSRPTLSLGYFQAAAERDVHAASRACDLVRRPSGGGAILHDRELTYCLVLPEVLAKAQPHTHWYFAVHRSLIAALAAMTGANGEFSLRHHALETLASREPFLCFQRRAEGDVLLGEHKIAGSAQRRRGGAILQHGSVLLARSPQAPELPGVSELTGSDIEFATLSASFAAEAVARLNFVFRDDSCTGQERETATHLLDAKYAHPSWTLRR